MTTGALVPRPSAEVFALCGQRPVTVGEFCADVEAVADALPDGHHLVNLCEDRYTFMVVFFAAIRRGQVNLLPAKRDISSAMALRRQYSGTSVVADVDSDGVDHIVELVPGINGSSSTTTCDEAQTVAVAFTSGSTGEPQPHIKTWRMLSTWRHVHWMHVPNPPRMSTQLVATVPPWHMYGLEWAMLVPTVAPLAIYCGANFYPRDVVSAIDSFGGQSILVSTPLHLRAMMKTVRPGRVVHTVISATAPLEQELMALLEANLQTRTLEIYGCSEVGSLAWRCASQDASWRFFDCFQLALADGVLTVAHDELPRPIALADLFESAPAKGTYNLLGRAADLVKVGGKRESLANLNGILVGIDGVLDGVFYLPEEHGLTKSGRLGALVVAPSLTTQQVRERLAARIDPIFLPRPIHLVDSLPRESTSKLTRSLLNATLAKLND